VNRLSNLFFIKASRRYTIFGTLFGVLFPLVGTFLAVAIAGKSFTLDSLLFIQRTTPLLWIIDTAPIVIGLFAGFAGRKQDTLTETNKQLRKSESELKNNQANLEQYANERTAELLTANKIIEHRTAQFEAIARIARSISSIQTLNELLPQITQTISDQFGFYHVGIFLADENKEYAILKSANSTGGKKMLERNHRMLIGGGGIVGFVTKTGQPRIALDVEVDIVFTNNPDLPNTHSEMALPLRVGSNIFGALDVQSEEKNAFSREDVNALSVLADLVSIAIQNAYSYSQMQEALTQAKITSAQASEQHWRQFLAREVVEGYYFDGVETKNLREVNRRSPHSLAVPLTLRGTHIGTIKLSASNPDRMWTDDEIDIARAVAERTSVALENARLLQEAQKRVSKERAIGEISTKIGSLNTLDRLFQTVIQELGNVLPDTDIAIQFKGSQESE
jgi:GAF domain-containing protein